MSCAVRDTPAPRPRGDALSARCRLQVSWRGPTILSANESASLLSLTLRAPEPLLQLTGHLVLHTNVTELRLPVTCYTGKLRPVRHTHRHLLHGKTQTGETYTLSPYTRVNSDRTVV